MDVKDIKKLLDALAASDTDEFTFETGDFKIAVKRAAEPPVAPRQEASAAPPPAAQPQPSSSSQALAPHAAAPPDPPPSDTKPDASHVEVTAPIVGTFYASPAPDAPPYVKVGDRVEAGTVLCIIEAMKLMNEIEAEVAGTVTEILVRNEEPVEYGQSLFRIEPS